MTQTVVAIDHADGVREMVLAHGRIGIADGMREVIDRLQDAGRAERGRGRHRGTSTTGDR